MKSSQSTQILKHIRTHGAITPLEALDRYGCFRLGARIYDLKNQGHPIRGELVTRNGKHFSRYSLIPRGQRA